jgi:hypothetical protein
VTPVFLLVVTLTGGYIEKFSMPDMATCQREAAALMQPARVPLPRWTVVGYCINMEKK